MEECVGNSVFPLSIHLTYSSRGMRVCVTPNVSSARQNRCASTCARIRIASLESPNGLRQLVDAYRRAGGVPLEAADVVNHELLLVLRLLEQSVRAEREERREGHPPSHWRNQIRAILRQAKSL